MTYCKASSRTGASGKAFLLSSTCVPNTTPTPMTQSIPLLNRPETTHPLLSERWNRHRPGSASSTSLRRGGLVRQRMGIDMLARTWPIVKPDAPSQTAHCCTLAVADGNDSLDSKRSRSHPPTSPATRATCERHACRERHCFEDLRTRVAGNSSTRAVNQPDYRGGEQRRGS